MECLDRQAGFLFMIRASWHSTVLAESDETVVVEGNHYFPAEAVHREYLRDSSTHSTCPWKGTASYHTVVVEGQENRDAAWYYPGPSPAAREIAGRVAFWRGVRIERVGPDAQKAKSSLVRRLMGR